MKLVLASRSFQIADGDGPAFTPFISSPPHLEIRSIFQNYYFSIPFARLSPPKKKLEVQPTVDLKLWTVTFGKLQPSFVDVESSKDMERDYLKKEKYFWPLKKPPNFWAFFRSLRQTPVMTERKWLKWFTNLFSGPDFRFKASTDW